MINLGSKKIRMPGWRNENILSDEHIIFQSDEALLSLIIANDKKIENRPGVAEIVRKSSELFWDITTETFHTFP